MARKSPAISKDDEVVGPDTVFAHFNLLAYLAMLLRLALTGGLFVFFTVRLVLLLIADGPGWLFQAALVLPPLAWATQKTFASAQRFVRARGRCLYVEAGYLHHPCPIPLYSWRLRMKTLSGVGYRPWPDTGRSRFLMLAVGLGYHPVRVWMLAKAPRKVAEAVAQYAGLEETNASTKAYWFKRPRHLSTS